MLLEANVPLREERVLELDLDGLRPGDRSRVETLSRRVEEFCAQAPLYELNVVFHSTGVNYAHQFWILGILGPKRLARFRSVHFVSGSVIAAIVYYARKTGNLQYSNGDAQRWEQDFFRAHALRPGRSAFQVPYRLARRLPLLESQAQIDVIQQGIGKAFGETTLSFFPPNFHFWLYDAVSESLLPATAENDLNYFKLAELAVAATAVPLIFRPLELGGFRFVDPVFSPARRELAKRLRKTRGPTFVSNMVVDRDARSRAFAKPHGHPSGRLLMVREVVLFILGLSNTDHVEGLEGGLGVVADQRD